MPVQLTFPLPARPALGREDFFVSPANAAALAALDAPQTWPQGKYLLIGPEGAGKSHLAAVWAAANGASIVTASDLQQADPIGLANAPALVIENADSAAGQPDLETALLHLHNLALAAGTPFLMTARRAPGQWAVRLPDLASRMTATALARIDPPDDALLAAVLVKLFADRQVTVPPRLIPYLIARIDRSFAAARALVDRLDARALAEGRPISRALAAEVLDLGGRGAQ